MKYPFMAMIATSLLLAACQSTPSVPLNNLTAKQPQRMLNAQSVSQASTAWQQELVKEIRQAFFRFYDHNQNQLLEPTELNLTHQYQNYTVLPPALVQKLSQNGGIGEQTFLKAQEPDLISGQDVAIETQKTWQKLDQDKNQALSMPEALVFYPTANLLDQAKLKKSFSVADKNQDLMLNFQEFPGLMRHYYFENSNIPVGHQAFVLRIEFVPPSAPSPY